MGNHRKQVEVSSESETFNRALSLMLSDHDVRLSREPLDHAKAAELLVWRIDHDTPVTSLANIASRTPTLLLAPTDKLITAVDSGCRGFLAENASLEEIRAACDTILQGGAVIPPDLLGTLLKHIVGRRRRLRTVRNELSSLTDREREVFALAAEGLRKEEIGEHLYISPATARTHLQRVYRKLRVHSQAELISLAVSGRLTTDTERDSE